MDFEDFFDGPNLPPYAGRMQRGVFHIDAEWFRHADDELRGEAMRQWFVSRYCDPALETPYNGREGGYLYIHGGPFSASEELYGEFADAASESLIQSVISQIDSIGIEEWAPVRDLYGDAFDLFADDPCKPGRNLELRLEELTTLEREAGCGESQQLLRQMLFAQMIVSLEVYLQEAMSFWVLESENHAMKRRFVEACSEFKSEKLNVSEVFECLDGLDDRIRQFIAMTVWHRLDRVMPLVHRTLDMEKIDFGDLAKAVLTRHNIIHRGGRDRKGAVVEIRSEELEQLKLDILSFRAKIDAAFPE